MSRLAERALAERDRHVAAARRHASRWVKQALEVDVDPEAWRLFSCQPLRHVVLTGEADGMELKADVDLETSFVRLTVPEFCDREVADLADLGQLLLGHGQWPRRRRS